jgi:RimJ/RimL family protein N-acetyltransferase
MRRQPQTSAEPGAPLGLPGNLLTSAYTTGVSLSPLPALHEPVTLSGAHVQLVPLWLNQCDGLIAAVSDGRLWELWYTSAPAPGGMLAEMERRLALQRAGSMLPFAVIDQRTGDLAGMTTLMNIDAANRRVEIGSTWYAQRVQRTGLNTEAKLLLLTHAFDTLGCIAVELRTHFMNRQSRQAIERLGAKLDGVLRNHAVMANGTLRDTCVYSILNTEWPAVRAHLRWQLQKPR